MKKSFLAVVGAPFFALSLMAQAPATQNAQSSTAELPSAPSAVAMPRQPEPPRPAPKSANNAAQPAGDTQPALKSLGQKTPANTPSSNSAPDSMLLPRDVPDSVPKPANSAAVDKAVEDEKIEVV